MIKFDSLPRRRVLALRMVGNTRRQSNSGSSDGEWILEIPAARKIEINTMK